MASRVPEYSNDQLTENICPLEPCYSRRGLSVNEQHRATC